VAASLCGKREIDPIRGIGLPIGGAVDGLA
jgi:hypothetical protein